MKYTSYIAAFEESVIHEKKMYRVDVVMFNLEPQEDGTDKSIDGEYYERDGDGHPFECLFDDLDEAIAYIKSFTSEMALDALATHTNYTRYDHVAVEITEMDEGFNPCDVISCCDWLYGTKPEYWFGWDCVGRAS